MSYTRDGADALLICDYAKGTLSADAICNLIDAARQAGMPVVVDPKGANYSRYRGATVIKPNTHELEQFTRRPIRTDAELREAGGALASELGGAVLLTQGPTGMTLFEPNAEPWHLPAAVG